MPLVGKKIDVSTDNFACMVRHNCLLVDKSLFIKEFLEGPTVSLITRFRRMGKSLILSQLHHFLAESVGGELTKGLFDKFNIAEIDNGEFLAKHQGQYPVIFITFKDIKKNDYAGCIKKIRNLIKSLYREHEPLLDSDKLKARDGLKDTFRRYLNGNATDEELEDALQFLTEFLHIVHTKKPVVLIDEYDAVLTSAYQYGFLDEMSDFMRNIFSAALKSNIHLERCLMTGILRVSKNNMLSGLNNLKTYSMIDDRYAQYFGFTEDEVIELAEFCDVTDTIEDIRQFYNGYKIGDQLIYNPWSLMNYLDEKQLKSHWAMTSNDNTFLRKIILRTSGEIKQKIAQLIQGQTIEGEISTNLRYDELMDEEYALWSLLLFCGYLSTDGSSPKDTDAGSIYILRIPNKEITLVYKKLFIDWFKEKDTTQIYQSFLQDLTASEMKSLLIN